MWRLVVIGVAVHLLLLSAVFDIYFVSPVLHGMTPHKPGGAPLAKRVVLIVADGLRADSLYNPEMKLLAPFLNKVSKRRSSWGVSHTQVPTESRPGHIAILAGFNEDPSAITKGWKYNPVDFDSVINQSTNAWCWGSPDIVDIFNRDNLSHIHLISYDSYMQDFSGKHVPAKLDSWVFNRVTRFFDLNKRDSCTDVCAQGNIFFLHLLGLDTAGHSYKPNSETYLTTIQSMDLGVEKVVRRINNFFEDKRTAFIFTADHGMTNWGSHGDGSSHETEVPLIAWGSGINTIHSRQDVDQLNIAPLISALLGINFPINSLGVVPANYLNASSEQLAYIMNANMLQLAEQYIMKHLNLKANTMSLLFKPFEKLSKDNYFLNILENITSSIKNKNYDYAVDKCFSIIELFKDGMKYYDNYYQTVLLFFVTTGFVGWIVYLFISIKDLNTHSYDTCKRRMTEYYSTMWNIPGGILAISILICSTPFASSLPVKYYLYFLFPVVIWCLVLSNYKTGMISLALLSTFTWKEFILLFFTTVYEIQLLMLTFFRHVYLTVLFVYLAVREGMRRYNNKFSIWIIGLFFLGLCPIIGTMQTTFNPLNHIIAIALWVANACVINARLKDCRLKRVLTFQYILLIIAFVNTLVVEGMVIHDYGVSYYSQLISWTIFLSVFIYPFLTTTSLYYRVLSCILALITPYTLMAVGYESIFMFFFCQQVLKWITTEHTTKMMENPLTPELKTYDSAIVPSNTLTNLHNVKMCVYLLAFIMLGYFGTGNTASINSFDPMWTRCFVTVFSPFTMATLILIKLTIPFLIVMCAFRAVMIINEAQVRNTFLIILLCCDLMVIQLLYLVQNEGSWLYIGMSLSRFIIANVTTIVLLLLYQVASFLMGRKLPRTVIDFMVNFTPFIRNMFR